MENFVMYNPTRLHFGKGVVGKMPEILSGFGKKVLLVYGKGSVKKNGAYRDVVNQLVQAGTEIFEYSGIKPNPVIEDVDAAAQLGRDKKVNVIVAVGGGSVIDSAKAIAITIPVGHSGWDFFNGAQKPSRAIPLISVLTLAATGTEMNMFAVVQNDEAGQKNGYGHPLMYPTHSLLDPTYTLSVPKDHTAYGIADLMAHCLENYFGRADAPLTDRFIFSILREAVENGHKLLANLSDYELRARIMYAATVALNGTTAIGKGMGDWGVHSIGHHLSLLYGTPHGASLTIIYPAYLKVFKSEAAPAIERLGREVFGVIGMDETILKLEEFFASIGCPVRISESISSEYNEQALLNLLIRNKAGGNNFRLNAPRLEKLLELAR